MLKGTHPSPEAKARMKAAHNTPEYLKKNSRLHSGSRNGFYGKKHTPEVREKIRQSKLGKKWSKAKKQKQSILLRRIQAGKHSVNYKGGISKSSQGYMLIWSPGHPSRRSSPYIFRSHAVIEKIIGRVLPLGSVVHHINKRRADDHPKNLMALTQNGPHKRIHAGKEPKPEEIIFDGRKYHDTYAS